MESAVKTEREQHLRYARPGRGHGSFGWPLHAPRRLDEQGNVRKHREALHPTMRRI